MGGADGLIFGIQSDGEGRPRRVTWSDGERYQPASGFLWLHLDAESEGAARWVREEGDIDPVLQDALLAEETRPRTVVHQDALLLILRAVNLNPGEESDDMVSLRVYVDKDHLVTLWRRPVRTVDAVRASLEEGRVEGTAGDLLVAICDQLTSYVSEVVEGVQDKVDALEDQILTAESRELRTKISDLRRTMIALRRYLAPQREAVARVPGERLSWLGDRQRSRLREITDRCLRQVEELDAAREHAGVAYEELTGRLAERAERRMYLLSIVAAIFLPLGFVTGLLGINVGGMPGAEDPTAFTYVLVGCVVAALLSVIWMRRWRWI